MELDRQKSLELIRQMCLMDDVFFNVCMDGNIECMQLILRIILNNDKLEVKEVTAQRTIPNINYRGVRFDVMATADGKVYDIEVQRSDEGAIPRRARYNASMMDAKELRAGVNYDKLPESYVIFITENDVLGDNLPIYHVARIIQETSKPFEDGSHIIYVNGKNRDNATPLGRLMQDFFCKSPDDMNYKEIASRVRYFKEDEGGIAIMSPIAQQIFDEGENKGRIEGRIEGKIEGKGDMIIEMLKDNQPLELIAKFSKFTIEKIKEIAKINNIDIREQQ